MKTEAWFDELDETRALQPEVQVGFLLKALKQAPGAVLAKSFKVFSDIQPDPDKLVAAFKRLLTGARKSDPGCLGKEALCRHSLQRDLVLPEFWLAATHCIQEEPVFGGRVDTAATLRGLGALGLMRSSPTEAPLELARLLADPEVECRRGCIEALHESRADWAAALLMHRFYTGVEELNLQSEILAALLDARPEEAMSCIHEIFRGKNREQREAACMALPELSEPEHAELLWRELDEQILPEERRPFWVALALMRCEEGRGRLLEEIPFLPAARRDELREALASVLDEELENALEER